MIPELQEAVTQYLAAQPTLRDQFAMAALSALVLKEWHPEVRITIANLAVESYRYADAMLEARKEQP